MMEIGFYGNVIQLIYLAKVLGVNRQDWSLAFEGGSLSFFDGILSSIYEGKDFYLKEDFILEMLRDLAASDLRFKPYFKTYRAYTQLGYPFGERLEFGPALKSSPLLLQRQRESGQPLPEVKTESLVTPPEVLLKASTRQILDSLEIKESPFARCLSCHEGIPSLLVGRKIPFSSPALLKKALDQVSVSSTRSLFDEILERVKPDSVGHMPPFGESLSQKEIEDLRRYLVAVLMLSRR